MKRLSKSQIEATAYHEAGHAVVAYVLGYRPQSVTIVPTIDAAGHIVQADPLYGLQHDIDGSHEVRLRVESFITICFAGPITQKRYNPRSWRRAHGQWDYDKIAELGLRVCGSDQQAAAFIRWREIVACDMVRAHWLRIQLVAGQLLERERLGQTDLDAIIGPRAGIRLS
ncbi:MAG TPA: hypothetical protein VMV19_09630 [Xanthobacteraceae bacterium]|nr:hypothetical protein [Xanthobacteraceae bacterium]